MKRTLSLVIMAAALLLTQCRKPSIEFPTPSVTTTVSMTITAGPGSKTDITTAGGIVWSANDKIYVGDGAKCIGCLSIVSGVGNATGTFTGDVTATTGVNRTFHFYYLGSTAAPAVDATEVTVDFSSQDIYADGGKLKNASGQHVGYGKVEGVDVEADKPITGIQVDMKSKVAIAYFCFESGTETPTPYTDALTLSGEHIYNKMTVRFNASDFDFTPVKDGNISLNNTTTHLKYAMLVPAGTTEETLNFVGGDMTGTTTLANGIEANKFYRVDGSMPIEVTVTKPKFTVDATGTTVEFSPGNLYWDGTESKFRFESNQWDYSVGDFYEDDFGQIVYNWDPSHVSHFKWSDADNAVTGSYGYSGDLFCANNFTVAGDSRPWRTLSEAEWDYLLNSRDNASSLHDWVTLTDVSVSGLVLLPDGSTATASGITTSEDLAAAGVVFLPAAGYRYGAQVLEVGSDGYYWSITRDGSNYAYKVGFDSGSVYTGATQRSVGNSVRLVRDIPNASVNGSANDFNGGTW